MPFFHGTRRVLLPSIMRHGLGGVDIGPNVEDCVRGVYLASDPRLCLAILLGQTMALMDETSSPREELASWVVIVIDDTRINRQRLRADPHVDSWHGSWLYDGVIDVTNAPLLDIDQVYQGWQIDPAEVGWVDV